MALIQPKEYYNEKAGGTFILSKFPATVGREIMLKYPMYNAPLLFDFLKSDEAMMLVMRHVAKQLPDRQIILENKTLLDQHISPGLHHLLEVEWAELKYNFDFFESGSLSDIWKILREGLEGSAVRILTHFVDSSSLNMPQPSANSENITPLKTSN